MPCENILKERPTKNGFALYLFVKKEKNEIINITMMLVNINATIFEPEYIMNIIDKKQLNPIAPSMNTAKEPVYSVSKAPSIANIKGAEV
jgi:hypothetical protein